MSRLSRPRRHAFSGLLAAALYCLSTGVTAEQIWKLGMGDKSTKYQPFKDPGGRFEIEYPAKDWKLLPSGGSSLAVFARNDGPTLFIDHVRLTEALTPVEVAGMPAVELSTLKEQQPKGRDFKSEMVDSKAGKGVLIRYSRDSATGTGPETVVQYSIAVGLELFRLNGVMPDKQVAKYEPVIDYMIQSFKAPAAASTSKH